MCDEKYKPKSIKSTRNANIYISNIGNKGGGDQCCNNPYDSDSSFSFESEEDSITDPNNDPLNYQYIIKFRNSCYC